MIGTANFDNRSFRLNFEIMCVVADPEFNTEVEQMLLADIEKSVEMQPSDLIRQILTLGAKAPSPSPFVGTPLYLPEFRGCRWRRQCLSSTLWKSANTTSGGVTRAVARY